MKNPMCDACRKEMRLDVGSGESVWICTCGRVQSERRRQAVLNQQLDYIKDAEMHRGGGS